MLSETNLRQSETEKKTTILAADDWSVSRVRCEDLDKNCTESADGGEQKKQIAVVSGKTYIVATKNGEIEVTDVDNEAVTIEPIAAYCREQARSTALHFSV